MENCIIKGIKSFLIIGILLIYQIGISQEKSKNNVNVINGFSKSRKDIPAKIISNKKTGNADSIPALIKFKIVDNKDIDIESTKVTFNNLVLKETFTVETEELKANDSGNFSIYLKPSTYNILFHNYSYGNLRVEKLKLISGQKQEIIINLGSRIVIECGQIIEGKRIELKSKASH